MSRPLVLPKGLIALIIGQPVILHEAQSVILASVLEEGSDVLVGTRAVTVLTVGAVAVVGPEAVDSPRIIRTGHWVGIPKLNLLDQAVWAADTASVGGGAATGEN